MANVVPSESNEIVGVMNAVPDPYTAFAQNVVIRQEDYTFWHCALRELAVGNAPTRMTVVENKGLVGLHLWYDIMKSDETWGATCDSLETHPTLEVLEFRKLYANHSFAAPSVITSRVQALVDMLKGNMSIHTIGLNDYYSEHELSVGPSFLISRRIGSDRAFLISKKTRPIMYRAKVLGRALLAVQSDPNRFWKLLPGNPEVAFLSTTTTIAAAADLQTPATAAAAASSTTNVAAAASVMTALTTTATGSLSKAAAPTATNTTTPSTTAAAANAVIPFASQKDKARP